MQLPVKISVDCPLHNLVSDCISRIRFRRSPVNISGKLVEQYYQGQRTIWRRLPVQQQPLTGRGHERTKTGPNFFVN